MAITYPTLNFDLGEDIDGLIEFSKGYLLKVFHDAELADSGLAGDYGLIG